MGGDRQSDQTVGSQRSLSIWRVWHSHEARSPGGRKRLYFGLPVRYLVLRFRFDRAAVASLLTGAIMSRADTSPERCSGRQDVLKCGCKGSETVSQFSQHRKNCCKKFGGNSEALPPAGLQHFAGYIARHTTNSESNAWDLT